MEESSIDIQAVCQEKKCDEGRGGLESAGAGLFTTTRDGTRVVVKPVENWADFRVAFLLNQIHSPYLPRCLGWSPACSREFCGPGGGYTRIPGRGSEIGQRERASCAKRQENGSLFRPLEISQLPEDFPDAEVSLSGAFCFEWIDGRPLREMDKKEITPTSLEQWFNEVLSALTWLNYCAGAPFAHLDISPDNIIISLTGEAVPVDFSGARILDNEAWTPETSRVFKDGYAAPEIFLGDLLPESDLFALAMTVLSVWRDEAACAMNQSSIRSALKRLPGEFAGRLRACLSENPVCRREALSDQFMHSIWAEARGIEGKPIQQGRADSHQQESVMEREKEGGNDRLSSVCEKSTLTTEGAEDRCPYSLNTCPFLEVAYIICGE